MKPFQDNDMQFILANYLTRILEVFPKLAVAVIGKLLGSSSDLPLLRNAVRI